MLNGGEKKVIIISWDIGLGFLEIRDGREKF